MARNNLPQVEPFYQIFNNVPCKAYGLPKPLENWHFSWIEPFPGLRLTAAVRPRKRWKPQWTRRKRAAWCFPPWFPSGVVFLLLNNCPLESVRYQVTLLTEREATSWPNNCYSRFTFNLSDNPTFAWHNLFKRLELVYLETKKSLSLRIRAIVWMLGLFFNIILIVSLII